MAQGLAPNGGIVPPRKKYHANTLKDAASQRPKKKSVPSPREKILPNQIRFRKTQGGKKAPKTPLVVVGTVYDGSSCLAELLPEHFTGVFYLLKCLGADLKHTHGLRVGV